MATVKTKFTAIIEKFNKLVNKLREDLVTAGVCSMKELAADTGPGFQEREMDKQVKQVINKRDTHSTPTLL